jgi:hypothetical protein
MKDLCQLHVEIHSKTNMYTWDFSQHRITIDNDNVIITQMTTPRCQARWQYHMITLMNTRQVHETVSAERKYPQHQNNTRRQHKLICSFQVHMTTLMTTPSDNPDDSNKWKPIVFVVTGCYHLNILLLLASWIVNFVM